MALCAKGANSGRVFVFKQKSPGGFDLPGDLKGYFISYFEMARSTKKQPSLKLEDSSGFKAALRTAIIELARHRGMWGERGLVDEQTD